MSFAPPYRTSTNVSQQSMKNLNQQSPSSSNYNTPTTQSAYMQGNNQSLNQRLDFLESNLNRVCNQHDALMPLLQLLEQMPQISKNEAAIKSMKTKQSDIENKINKLDPTSSQSGNQHVFGTIERNFKNTNNQVGSLKNEIQDITNNVSQINKVQEVRLKDEATQLHRNIDIKLEKNKRDIQNLLAEFKNQVSLSLKRQEESSNSDRGQSRQSPNSKKNSYYQSPDDPLLKEKVEQYTEQIRMQYEKDVSNLYREVGMLRSELELIYDKGRRDYIFDQIKQMPKEQAILEKKLNIANLEQKLFFDELERFDKENQERLMYELDCLEDKLTQIHQDTSIRDKQNSNQLVEYIKHELGYVEDRYFNLKQQIHGTKKKYLVDIRKVEDKLNKLNQLKQKAINELQRPDLPKEIQNIDFYNVRVEKINESINGNVEMLQSRQRSLDDKLLVIKNSF